VQAVCNTSSSAFTEAIFTLPSLVATGLYMTTISTTSATINWTPAHGFNTYSQKIIKQ